MKTKACIDLYDYQKKFINNKSSEIIILWPRQSGKTYSIALKIALSMVENYASKNKKVCKWYLISASQEQSKEILTKIKNHLIMLSKSYKIFYEKTLFDEGKFLSETVKLTENIYAKTLPCNANTIFGETHH